MKYKVIGMEIEFNEDERTLFDALPCTEDAVKRLYEYFTPGNSTHDAFSKILAVSDIEILAALALRDLNSIAKEMAEECQKKTGER